MKHYRALNGGYLTKEAIRANSTSILTKTASPLVSSRYSFIDTEAVIDRLNGNGWLPVSISESGSKNPGYQCHQVRFREAGKQVAVGDSFPEMVLTTSHDAKRSFQFNAGFFRLVCSNGLVVGDSSFYTNRLRHSGNIGMLDTIVSNILNSSMRLFDTVGNWRNLEVSPDVQARLASDALRLLYGESEPFPAALLLSARRSADKSNDLWSVFNKIQENSTAGGIRYSVRNDDGTYERHTTRAIRQIDKATRFNKELWNRAAELVTV
jgi:hypothetical protein